MSAFAHTSSSPPVTVGGVVLKRREAGQNPPPRITIVSAYALYRNGSDSTGGLAVSFQLMAWAVRQRTGSPTEKAVLLALANRANHETGKCCPSAELIAEETEFGTTAVKRALRSLAEKGFVKRERLRRRDGSLSTFNYTFPDVAKGREASNQGHEASLGLGTRGVPQEPGKTFEPEERSTDLSVAGTPRALWKVDRKPVTDAEDALAREVLARWNAAAGQTLSSKDWLAKIVMRIREHPELDADAHETIVRAALAAPWWRGPASPSVVYGSGAQFERSILQAQNPGGGRGLSAVDVARIAQDQLRRSQP